MASTPAPLDDLVARFTAATLPKDAWTHRAHVAVGAWHVDRYGPDEALARLRVGIRRLNDAHGTPNSATSGYHETVTRAFVTLLADALAGVPAALPLGERVALVLAGPLADRDVLGRFYTRERLMSAAARAAWVEPDRPLRIAAA